MNDFPRGVSKMINFNISSLQMSNWQNFLYTFNTVLVNALGTGLVLKDLPLKVYGLDPFKQSPPLNPTGGSLHSTPHFPRICP